jgi:hypothetical protein
MTNLLTLLKRMSPNQDATHTEQAHGALTMHGGANAEFDGGKWKTYKHSLWG